MIYISFTKKIKTKFYTSFLKVNYIQAVDVAYNTNVTRLKYCAVMVLYTIF